MFRVCLVAMIGVFTWGCVPVNDGVVCTAVFVYGVNVTVADENGNPVSGATLTLTDGDYTEVMEEFEPGTYVGAGERAGTYSLTVEAEGFESTIIEGIAVDEDECHVIGVTREVTLTPA